MDVTMKRVESSAPDQASLKAARKLLDRKKWPALHQSGDGVVIWGECQGSGSQPYRVAVDIRAMGAKCSCPSRKFPCKHSLALTWWRADEIDAFSEAKTPDWVNEWLGLRRPVAERTDTPAVNIAAVVIDVAEPASDPEAEAKKLAKARAQRARNRMARETSIHAGLDELDTWIADQLERGLGAFMQSMTEQCRVASQCLADAKAGPLASRIDMLPARVLTVPDLQRQRS